MRVKGDTQQPFLAPAIYTITNIEERLRKQISTFDDANHTLLLDDVQTIAAVVGVGDVYRRAETTNDFLECDGRNW